MLRLETDEADIAEVLNRRLPCVWYRDSLQQRCMYAQSSFSSAGHLAFSFFSFLAGVNEAEGYEIPVAGHTTAKWAVVSE